MTSRTARKHIEAFWSKNLPAPGGGVSVGVHCGALIGYPGVYAVQRRGEAIVSVPAELVVAIARLTPSYDDVMSPAWWNSALPDWTVLGPSVHSFLHNGSTVRADPLVRSATLAKVHEAMAPMVDLDEWEEGGFADSAVEHAWLLTDDDGSPVAASILTIFQGMPVDLGVVTARNARGHGYGRRVASTAVDWAVRNYGIARWRALESNHPSRSLAAKLGFEDDARQIAVRPPR